MAMGAVKPEGTARRLLNTGARKLRPYSALAPSSKNKPFFKKCCPNFIPSVLNDLRCERAEKLDTVCHTGIIGYCI